MPTAGEDGIDSLLAQHQQITFLFAQVLSTEGDHKQALFDQLVALLAVHEAVEGSVVHPTAAADLPDGGALVSDRLAEEESARAALSQLYELGVAHPEFNQRLAELWDDVATHAEAEEQLEFVRLRERSAADDLARLTAVMLAASPLSATGTGPPDEVFERTRATLMAATGEQA